MISKIKSRLSFAAIASAFGITLLAPILLVGSASAYGQVQSRSIEMSSSVQSQTSVSYLVSFDPATTGNIGGIDVDFCSNDPIIGDTCTAPAGFSVGASPTISALTGFSTSTGSWGATSNGPANTLYVTNATVQTVSGISTPITFTLTGVTNPSALGSFYARILTFDTQGDATAYTSGQITTITGLIDAGGVALSTVQQLLLTSKVQEVITFCVYTSSLDGGNCTGTGTSVLLGNSNDVLSTANNYVDNSTKYDIQTNALHGVVIRFTGTVPTSGSNVIEASTSNGMGASSGTAYTSSTGTPQFGLCSWSTATGGGTVGNLTPAAPYNSGSCSSTSTGASGDGGASFAFNISNAASTYGDTLANATAGAYAQGQIAFIGNISNTTVAGIYTTALTFIATGKY